MTFVHVSRRGAASWAVLDRPERGNALGPEIATELATWIERSGGDPTISCLVLGASGKAFCAGADVKATIAMVNRPDERRAFFADTDRLLRSFADVPVPVIAAVDGVAFAGGLELVLVLACDVVVAGPNARFGDLHLANGRIPAWGSAARLTGAVGHWRASAALFLPQVFTALEMQAAGLVAKVSAAGELDRDIDAMAEHFADLDRHALRAMKELVVAQRMAEIGPLLELGAEHFRAFLAGPGMATLPPAFGLARQSGTSRNGSGDFQ